MTPLLPELEVFPVQGVFDGELIAFTDGQPDFVALCDRMLLRNDLRVPVAFVAFDVLSLEGTTTMREPYWKRRLQASAGDVNGRNHFTGDTRMPMMRAWGPRAVSSCCCC